MRFKKTRKKNKPNYVRALILILLLLLAIYLWYNTDGLTQRFFGK